jgi:hypothetical protein
MKYITSDGQEFADLKSARQHEREITGVTGRGFTARPLTALPADLVEAVKSDPGGEAAVQIMRLAGQVSKHRRAAGLSKKRAPKAAAPVAPAAEATPAVAGTANGLFSA